MSVMVFNPDKLTITPTPQKTKSFGANSGLHTISQMINAWLEENPTVRIIQMIHENNCVLLLYENTEVVITDG